MYWATSHCCTAAQNLHRRIRSGCNAPLLFLNTRSLQPTSKDTDPKPQGGKQGLGRHLAPALRQQPRPRDRESENLNPQAFQKGYVFLVAVVEVTCRVACQFTLPQVPTVVEFGDVGVLQSRGKV